MKPKLIILEGISGSGKTALVHPVNELSNYADVVTARFTPSCWVYNQLYTRPDVDYELMNRALMEEHEVHVIWLRCDPKTALARCVAKGDDRVEDLYEAEALFGQYFMYFTAFIHIHEVSTNQPLEYSVAMIRDRVYGSN